MAQESLHKYEVVAAGIITMIEDASPHDLLPTERALMEMFGVSRMTIRAAVRKLSETGQVYNVPGSGMYVGFREVFSKSPRLTSFTEDMRSRGLEASSRVLSAQSVRADSGLAARLGLELDAPCFRLHRLRLANSEPMAIEEVFVPESILRLDDLDLGQSLYEQFASRGLQIYRAEQEVLAVILSASDCQLLQVPDGSAAIGVHRVSSSNRGRPIEFARTFYRSDRYTFRMIVNRDEAVQ